MKKTSAKDLAFEKERVKYRKEIKFLEGCIEDKNHEIVDLKIQVLKLEGERDQLQDWVDRLLVFMDMSKEDLDRMIQEEKRKAELLENVMPLFKFMGKYGL